LWPNWRQSAPTTRAKHGASAVAHAGRTQSRTH
jgi:hypothetical protein